LFFAIDRFSRGVNWRSIIAGAALFAGAFLALRLLPLFRVNDPSPMAWRGDPAGLMDLSAYAPNAVKRRVGRLRMGRAPQTIWHFFKPTTTVDLPLARSGEYYLMFAARPRVAFESAGCRKIDLVLNEFAQLNEHFRQNGIFSVEKDFAELSLGRPRFMLA